MRYRFVEQKRNDTGVAKYFTEWFNLSNSTWYFDNNCVVSESKEKAFKYYESLGNGVDYTVLKEKEV